MNVSRSYWLVVSLLAACAESATDPDTESQVSALESDDSPVLLLRDHQGQTRSVTLESNQLAADSAKLAAEEASSPENVRDIYRHLYRTLEGTRFIRTLALPDPDSLSDADVPRMRTLIRSIVRMDDDIQRSQFPDYTAHKSQPMTIPTLAFDEKPCIGGYPAELGAGTHSDMTTLPVGHACGLSPTGIVYNDPRTYRSHLSCIKDQGNRGTCGAFAIASALEMENSMQYGTKIDLSEQMAYYHARGPALTTDGIFVNLTLDDLASGFSNEQVPYESLWNYNPSPLRMKSKGVFVNSCVGYNEDCSDDIKQPTLFPIPGGGGFLEQTPPYKQGVGIAHHGTDIWDSTDLDLSILLMKAALFTNLQLLAVVMINDSLKGGAEGNGFIDYQGQTETAKGWHVLHIVGYVDNVDLPNIAPSAPPAIDGGYFIARNSWGPCTGDGGYLYIPYIWMKGKDFVSEVYQLDPEDLVPMP